jgi:hypothetical protein
VLSALAVPGNDWVTGLVEVNTRTVHAASLNSSNVTVPVGLSPPASVANPRTLLEMNAVVRSAVVVRTGVGSDGFGAATAMAAVSAPTRGSGRSTATAIPTAARNHAAAFNCRRPL